MPEYGFSLTRTLRSVNRRSLLVQVVERKHEKATELNKILLRKNSAIFFEFF